MCAALQARRPCAGSVPGRWGACLAVRTPPAAVLRTISYSLLQLSRLLEPFLVLGRLLPSLVGRPRADQVHVGAKIFAVLAGAVAGAVGAKAEVVRGDPVRRRGQFGDEIAPLISHFPFARVRIGGAPELLPLGNILGAV